MSQPNRKYKRLEALLSEARPADPNPLVPPVDNEADALKVRVASLEAELEESRMKPQTRAVSSESSPTILKVKPVMSETTDKEQADKLQARNAFLIATAIAIAHFVAVAYYLYLGRTTGAAQFNALAVISFVLGLLIGTGAILSRRGRPTLGLILTLGSMAVSYPPVAAAFVSGLGVVLGPALMGIGPMSAFQILPKRSRQVMTIITIVAGLATLLLDVFGSTVRPPLPGIVIQLLAASVMGMLVFFIVRQFLDYSLRTRLVLGFLGLLVMAGLFGAFAIRQQFGVAEQAAVTEAGHVAETLGQVIAKNQVDLQELTEQIHITQRREIRVVDLNQLILTSPIPESIGTIYAADQHDEVAATLSDGQPRAFLETSADYPQGIELVVVPVRDEHSGTIIGAVLLDYTQALQESSFAEAEGFTKEIAATIAYNPAGLQNLINALHTARGEDMVVIDPQKQILADAKAENVGGIYALDLGSEVTATLQDGQQRAFLEISVDHPRGIQQVVTPLKDANSRITGATILATSSESQETAIQQAVEIAETIGVEVSQNRSSLQELITQLSETQGRDAEVVNTDMRIIADAVPENIGTIFDADQNDEVAATLKDGQLRTFVELNEDYPQGTRQAVTPIKDESGKIVGAFIWDYTSTYDDLQRSANTATRSLIFLGLGGLLLALVMSQYISASIANPISQLSSAAQKIGNGQLDTPIPALSSKDEVGILANSFNSMLFQLRDLFSNLDKRVQDRTHDLELASEVGRTITEKVSNLYGMLSEATEMIRSRFGLYYTQVYLLDPSGSTLTLRAGTGDVGQQLLQRGHHLLVNSGSLNGRAVSEKESILVADTAKNPNFLPNPLLPNTRSEMAVPLIVSGRVLGVLDMQSETPDALNQSNLPIFETMAGQLSIAIQNATLFAQSEEARKQVEANVRQITESGWGDFLNAIERGEKIGYTYNQTDVIPIENMNGMESANALNVPITVTGANVGAIQLVEEARKWTAQETEIVQAAAEQLAQHIDNLRLLAQAESYRSEAEQAARRLTREGWETFLQTRSDLTGFTYDLNNVHTLDSGNNNGHFESAITKQFAVRNETIGELAASIGDKSPEEINDLISAVAEQLGSHIENLRLSEQNEKRAFELATVATVSTTASTVLDPDKLLQSVVDLTKERFNMYHAHIYLADESWNTLLLAAGAGEIGRQMVETGHAIQIDTERSLVARASRERKFIIVNDVRGEAGFLPNPMLPETRAEMAVPMIVGDKVIGVFDVQADTVDYFTDEDANIYTTLASQVAVALQNARLYVEQAATVTQLRELDRLKSSFLANMSHELRTPLNSILGFADVMLEELDGPLTENMSNDLSLIYKNGQHLLHLINDVLDMAKIESGKMNLNIEKFNLQETIEEVVSITSPLASEKNLALFIEPDSDHKLEIHADKIRLRQVMINIINNSIKFTDIGKVSIRVAREENNVLISVKDTGLGIPADLLESVFQEFTQVDTTTTRKEGGTGLGLPISRRLIEMHSGRLWAESSGIEGEGSTFFVSLPIEARVNEEVAKAK